MQVLFFILIVLLLKLLFLLWAVFFLFLPFCLCVGVIPYSVSVLCLMFFTCEFFFPKWTERLTRVPPVTQTSRGMETDGGGPSRSHPAIWGPQPGCRAPSWHKGRAVKCLIAAWTVFFFLQWCGKKCSFIVAANSYMHVHCSLKLTATCYILMTSLATHPKYKNHKNVVLSSLSLSINHRQQSKAPFPLSKNHLDQTPIKSDSHLRATPSKMLRQTALSMGKRLNCHMSGFLCAAKPSEPQKLIW